MSGREATPKPPLREHAPAARQRELRQLLLSAADAARRERRAGRSKTRRDRSTHDIRDRLSAILASAI